MSQTYPRTCCLLILALASSACGAASGSSANTLPASGTATLTEFALPPEATPTPSASPSVNPDETSNSTLTPTIGASSTAPRPVVTVGPLCDDARFDSDVTIPDGTEIDPGVAFKKTWGIRNTGTCNWTTAYTLVFAGGDAMAGVTTPIPNAVDPGNVTEVSLDLVAPAIAGTYIGNWQLKNAGGFFFGSALSVQIVVPTIGAPSTATPTVTLLCDDAIYVSDVTIPDGTEIDPGVAFKKTWSIRNRGSCNWTTAYTLVFAGGDVMGGATTPIPNAVNPGDVTEVSLDLVAPKIAGTYIGHWQLRNAEGFFFGSPLFVQIVVPKNADDA